MLQSQIEIINHLVDKEAFEYLFPVMGWSDIVGMRLDIKRTEVVVTSVALPKKNNSFLKKDKRRRNVNIVVGNDLTERPCRASCLLIITRE